MRAAPSASRRPAVTLLAVAVDDAAARQVVRRELDPDAVPRRDADEVAPHAPRGVGDELVAVLELDLEHGVRQGLRHDGVHDDRCFFLVAIVAIRLASLRGSRAAPWTFGLSQ